MLLDFDVITYKPPSWQDVSSVYYDTQIIEIWIFRGDTRCPIDHVGPQFVIILSMLSKSLIVVVLLLVTSICYARDRIISYTDKNGNTVYTVEPAPSNRADTSSKGDLIRARDNGEVNKRSGNGLLDNNANKANSINQPGALLHRLLRRHLMLLYRRLLRSEPLRYCSFSLHDILPRGKAGQRARLFLSPSFCGCQWLS